MFGSAYERSNLNRREDGRIEEEREEARITELYIIKKETGRESRGASAYRSRKDANIIMSVSQMNKSAAPENRAGKEKSSAKRRSEGRARLCSGAQVGSGGLGGGVGALFG